MSVSVDTGVIVGTIGEDMALDGSATATGEGSEGVVSSSEIYQAMAVPLCRPKVLSVILELCLCLVVDRCPRSYLHLD